jgi:restriction system protein
MQVLFTVLFLFCILIFVIFYYNVDSRKHKRNIDSSYQVLRKIRSFAGPGIEPRILLYLRKINAYVFEEVLLTVFEEKGFRIKRNHRYSGDGGIDGTVIKEGKRYLIQAKRYKGHINSKHLAEFKSKVISFNADGGYFIHTGRTSREQLNINRYSNLQILSGEKLVNFILK